MISRNRILTGVVAALLVSTLGMSPAFHGTPWPIKGGWPIAAVWAAVAWSAQGMSVRAAFALALIGLWQDFLQEAPLGAWPVACLAAYGAALLGRSVFPAQTDIASAEAAGLGAGLLGGAAGLTIAGTVAGARDVLDASVWRDLFLTGLFYFPVRSLFTRSGTEAIR